MKINIPWRRFGRWIVETTLAVVRATAPDKGAAKRDEPPWQDKQP